MIRSRKHPIFYGTLAGMMLTLLLTLPAHAEVTQEFHRTLPLAADGRVSLDNINGDVEITGWDRNEVQIDAVKHARDQQRLDEMQIDVQTGGNSVDIKTRYPNRVVNNNPGGVDYKLHVPINARLDKINLVNGSLEVQKISGQVIAELTNGRLRAGDISGRAELSTVNGSVEANFSSLNKVDQIKLKSVNGSVQVTLPDFPNAEVEASTVSGTIQTDFPLEVKGGFMHKNVSGRLGSGGTRIELSDVNGSIHIVKGRGNL